MVTTGPGVLSQMQTVHRAGHSAGAGLGQGGGLQLRGPHAPLLPLLERRGGRSGPLSLPPAGASPSALLGASPSISSMWETGSLRGGLPREAVVSTWPGAYCPLWDQEPLTDRTARESSLLSNRGLLAIHTMRTGLCGCVHAQVHTQAQIYMCTCMTRTHTRMHAHIHRNTYTYVDTHIHRDIHAHSYTRMHTETHTCRQGHEETCTRTCMYTCIHTETHVDKHTRGNTRAHIHKRTHANTEKHTHTHVYTSTHEETRAHTRRCPQVHTGVRKASAGARCPGFGQAATIYCDPRGRCRKAEV